MAPKSESKERTIRPLGNRLLIEIAEPEEKYRGKLIIPQTAKEKPQYGKIVAAGEGELSAQTGTLIPMRVKVGDNVLFGKYSGTVLTFEGRDVLLLRESDLLAVLE